MLYRSIKKNSLTLVLCFSFFAVIWLMLIIALSIMLFTNKIKAKPEDAVITLVFFTLVEVLFVWGVVNNIRIAKRPELHKAIRKDPDIPDIIDEAYRNRKEDNKLFFFSEKTFVMKKVDDRADSILRCIVDI